MKIQTLKNRLNAEIASKNHLIKTATKFTIKLCFNKYGYKAKESEVIVVEGAENGYNVFESYKGMMEDINLYCIFLYVDNNGQKVEIKQA